MALRQYCALTHASVTSYGRTPKHNQEVGGVPFSAHQAWLAADVIYDGERGEQWRDQWALRLGLKLIKEHDHDHVQPQGWNPG